MRTHNATRLPLLKRFHVHLFIGVLAVLIWLVAMPLGSTRSSSAPNKDRSVSSVALSTDSLAKNLAAPASIFEPVFAPTVETFANDCVTPKTDFNLGDNVCVKASGAPNSPFFPWRISWVDPVGFVRQFDVASSNSSTEYHYAIPGTQTSVVNDQTVDNRGTWRVNLVRFTGQIQQSAQFIVHDTANVSSDVFVQKFARAGENTVPSGGNIAALIVVGNSGPDTATDVNLVDMLPSDFTLVSFNQESGPACLPAATSNCTIASLTNGNRAEFTAVYNSGGNAQGSYPSGATVSSTTADPDNSNNSSSFDVVITAPLGAGTCSLTCPTNVDANANTTEGGERGAHVTFDEAIGSGDCGSISTVPVSGSFFPVGTTLVHATSETGGGSCTFSVNVEDPNGNTTISCPANKQANADANCGATVNLGTPTATGENVTIVVSRSDGLPMYDCSVPGPNCVRDVRKTTDLPFVGFVNTVTWTAYSHDTPGPYADEDDEIAHRTGNAQCQQTVTVIDVTPPSITASNTSASANANCQAAVPNYSTLATVSDNCSCASSDTSEICDTRQTITITQTPAAGTMVGLGPHTIMLTANDGSSSPGPDGILETSDDGTGNTTTISVTFTVNDTTPPTFTFVPPTVVAYTGAGATTCDTVVSNATIGTATATDNCSAVTMTRSPSGNTFPVGNTTITWTATDVAGNHSSATQTVTVIDNTAPTITLNGSTPSMWPPNHKYSTFTVTNFVTSVSDNCGGVSVGNVVIDHVTSDETENGNGDGNTSNDIVIAADCKSVQLRSERDGGGDGRVYTITFRLRDTHGNVTTATKKVVVPHDQGGGAAVDSGVHYTVNGTCP